MSDRTGWLYRVRDLARITTRPAWSAALALCVLVLPVAADAATVSKPTFSVAHGFYSASFSVTVSSATAGSTIRYTTDGSKPTATLGTVLSNGGKVTVSKTTCLRAVGCAGGMTTSACHTQTYIFLDDVVRQTRPAGYPTIWGLNAADYDMDQNVVNSSLYSGEIKADLQALPTLSIAMAKDDLFTSSGVYFTGSGRCSKDASGNIIKANSIERPASAELIYPAGYPGAGPGFQVDCGIRAHTHVNVKRSFKLFFRGTWGPKKLDYPFFEKRKRG